VGQDPAVPDQLSSWHNPSLACDPVHGTWYSFIRLSAGGGGLGQTGAVVRAAAAAPPLGVMGRRAAGFGVLAAAGYPAALAISATVMVAALRPPTLSTCPQRSRARASLTCWRL
jgi:hypothetical protein